jgi:hypothetical protein
VRISTSNVGAYLATGVARWLATALGDQAMLRVYERQRFCGVNELRQNLQGDEIRIAAGRTKPSIVRISLTDILTIDG